MEAMAPAIGTPAARNPPKTSTITSRLIGSAIDLAVEQVLLHLAGDRVEHQLAAADLAAGTGHGHRDLGAELLQPRLRRVQRGVLGGLGQVGRQHRRHQETVAVLGNQPGRLR